MKRKYVAPQVQKLEFNYSNTVTASNTPGHKYRLYTDGYFGCRETETDIWVDEPPTP